MPLDPSIPLSVKPFQAPDPLEGYMKAMNLKSLMQESQVKGMQLEEMKSKLLGEQTLAKLMSDPANITNQGGMPMLNPQAEGKLMQASPSFGIEHAQQMVQFKQKVQQMNTEEVAAAKTKMDLMGKAAVGVMQVYQQAAQQNPQQAIQAATQARNQAMEQLVQMGAITQDMAKQIESKPFDLQEWQQKMQQSESYHQVLQDEHQKKLEEHQSRMEDIASRRADQADRRQSETERHGMEMEKLSAQRETDKEDKEAKDKELGAPAQREVDVAKKVVSADPKLQNVDGSDLLAEDAASLARKIRRENKGMDSNTAIKRAVKELSGKIKTEEGHTWYGGKTETRKYDDTETAPSSTTKNIPTISKDSEDWVMRALKENPGMTEEDVIAEGKRLGKVK